MPNNQISDFYFRYNKKGHVEDFSNYFIQWT
jgi:hypothetical protein